jgi:hypothetical protein
MEGLAVRGLYQEESKDPKDCKDPKRVSRKASPRLAIHCRDAPWGVSEAEREIQSATD